MTAEQIQYGTKGVTRRYGWRFLKAGDYVRPVFKGMGLKKGERVKAIRGPLRIVSVRREPLSDMSQTDCSLEGFPHFSRIDFITMLCKHYKTHPTHTITRIEFAYTDGCLVCACPHMRDITCRLSGPQCEGCGRIVPSLHKYQYFAAGRFIERGAFACLCRTCYFETRRKDLETTKKENAPWA